MVNGLMNRFQNHCPRELLEKILPLQCLDYLSTIYLEAGGFLRLSWFYDHIFNLFKIKDFLTPKAIGNASLPKSLTSIYMIVFK